MGAGEWRPKRAKVVHRRVAVRRNDPQRDQISTWPEPADPWRALIQACRRRSSPPGATPRWNRKSKPQRDQGKSVRHPLMILPAPSPLPRGSEKRHKWVPGTIPFSWHLSAHFPHLFAMTSSLLQPTLRTPDQFDKQGGRKPADLWLRATFTVRVVGEDRGSPIEKVGIL